MTSTGTLLLLPNLLGDHRHHELFLPISVDKAMQTIDGLIAESETGGRRYLGRFALEKRIQDVPLALYNEHTPDDEIDFLLEPIYKGETWGLISDSGLPCVVDPGYKLVRRARNRGVTIKAFVGPSSIMLSLMLSGFPGQSFTFHGYLERDSHLRMAQLKLLEQHSKTSTQIFIETPYRNRQMLQALLETLKDETLLCVAWDLTLPTQGILSQPIKVWKKSPPPNLDKRMAVFLVAITAEEKDKTTKRT